MAGRKRKLPASNPDLTSARKSEAVAQGLGLVHVRLKFNHAHLKDVTSLKHFKQEFMEELRVPEINKKVPKAYFLISGIQI